MFTNAASYPIDKTTVEVVVSGASQAEADAVQAEIAVALQPLVNPVPDTGKD